MWAVEAAASPLEARVLPVVPVLLVEPVVEVGTVAGAVSSLEAVEGCWDVRWETTL